ncbi:VIR protein [Plasmodium vivax]|uniref:VIR protein n=1 Tax=Plasmodium vivax TaxID=5855 RepID=A0A1G4EEW4_PLAVI|nr:VIR protein [Plasmodium vivax]
MVECSQSNNEYLDYNCYNRLYKYFTNDSIFKKNLDKLNIISKEVNISPYSLNEQKQIFNKLYEYLDGNGVFIDEDNTECCKYINFWLNDNVRKHLLDLYSENTFTILKGIVNLYNKNHLKNQRCITDISYIDPTLLGKMVALYNLYDKYYFLTINYIPYPYTLCSMIDEASGIFNDTINVHGDKDKNLLTRLKVFKPLMDNIVPKFTCSSNYRKHFIIPERFSDNKVTKPENQEQKEESSEHPLVSPDEHEKQQIIDSPGQSRNSEVNLHSETVTLERVTEASGNSRLVTGTSSQEDLDIYVQLSHSLDGRHAVEGDLLNVSHLQEGEYTDPLKDPTRLNLRGHPSAKETLGLQYTVGQQIEDPSLLGKMRTALSTMVDSVDPGPVLGGYSKF